METALGALARVRDRIAAAAVRSGRQPDDIVLVAVTKTVSYERVAPLLSAGVTDVGENRVQEAVAKYAGAKPSQLHLVGHLQSNKAKKAVHLFDIIQSLDSRDLAADLDRHAQALGKIQDCLIEVKMADDAAKTGVSPEALGALLAEAPSWPHVRIRGLMGIPPLSAAGDQARPFFQRLRRLRDDYGLEILSMGMSGDFETAIEEGATMVRIGTALFGARA